MEVAVLGGMFDPPHNGHIAAIRATLEQVNPKRLIVVVCGVPPHRDQPATAFGDRLLLAQQAFSALDERVVISDIERVTANDGVNRTVDTLRAICQKYQINDRRNISLVMGQDQFNKFKTWYCWQEISEMATLVVIPREPGTGNDVTDDYLPEAEVRTLNMEFVNCSSTDVRSVIDAGDFERAAAMVPPKVLDFYRKNADK